MISLLDTKFPIRSFIDGEDRRQATLFPPERVDVFNAEGSPTRVIDVFIDDLDLSVFGFGFLRLYPETRVVLLITRLRF